MIIIVSFERRKNKTKTIFNKQEYYFLAESPTIEKRIFPYKTALSKANVKTNRMGSTK